METATKTVFFLFIFAVVGILIAPQIIAIVFGTPAGIVVALMVIVLAWPKGKNEE